MILKKPYAFIIKHFKIIHLFLIVPIIFLLNRTRAISTFLNTYIKNNYTFISNDTLSSLASNYINIFMYLAIIIILVVLISLAIVLQKKEKSTKLYKFAIIYYIILMIVLTACFGIFTMIEKDTLGEASANLFRDISWIIYFSEYILIILFLIRGTGFNIRKFNFESELTNLEISQDDYEEFEFFTEKDHYKTKRTFRRFIREFKYYYLENKFVFFVIIIIAVLLLGITIYRNHEASGVSYREGANIAFGYINFTVEDSFIANLDMNGKEIKAGKAYVILQIRLHNRYREDKNFNYVNLLLKTNHGTYSPDLYLGNFFLDYGIPFSGNVVKGNTENRYILVYEINENEASGNLRLESYNDFGNKKIILKPTVYTRQILNNNVNKGTKISFNNTNLKETSLTIINYSLQNKVDFTYESCVKESCYTLNDFVSINYAKDNNKTLLALDYNLELDESSSYMLTNKNYKNFFEDFLEIKYTLDGKEYSVKPDIVNPNHYEEKLIMKVPREMNNAENIKAVVTVQNYAYSVTLK